jgi:hypothetical protein
MNSPADDKRPEEDLGDQIEDVAEEVVEALDDGLEEVEELGHAMDDLVDDFEENSPLAYRLFMWGFTLVLLIVVAWLCVRYYGSK